MPYRPAGKDNWYISYSGPGGRRVRESSGTTSFAEAKALEAKKKLEVHNLVKWGEKPPRTYDELMVTYLSATKKKKSHSRDLTSAARLTPHFTGRLVNKDDPEHVVAYKILRRGQGAAEATIAKEMLLYSAAVSYANDELGWELDNPVEGKVPQCKRDVPRWMRKEEAELLLARCRKVRGAARLESPFVLDFTELGLATGMRSGEILHLEWNRVDFGTRLIYFRGRDQKSGVPGSIPLNDWAIEVLRRRLAFRNKYCARAPWVFCYADGDRVQSLKKVFANAVSKEPSLKGVSPHTLRHTFAAWLVQGNVPLRTVRDLMRHSDIKTTMIYAHLAPENTREAIKVIERVGAPAAGDQKATSAGHSESATGVSGHLSVTQRALSS